MEPVTRVTGRAAPLPRANIDTDQIIPKQFLLRVERSGFGEFLFYDWSRDAEGEPDPGFVLNRPEYGNAVVLVTGPNFGSGSSREHAPWALEDWGFRAVVAPSFADIFYNNCTKIGLLPVVLTDAETNELMRIAEDPSNEITVDLDSQSVSAPGFTASFEIDTHTKECLLLGRDDVAVTLLRDHRIGRFEGDRPVHKPTTRVD